MPHYEDGTEARVGDHVVGRTHDGPDEVAGVVVQVTPGTDTCNLIVAYLLLNGTLKVWGLVPMFVYKDGSGVAGRFQVRCSLGDAKAFRKVGPSVTAPEMVGAAEV